MQTEKVVTAILAELKWANQVNDNFTSPHHGYAIILEELDELWDEVKKKHPDIRNMRSEAVQVAAMAMKFIMSMENDWKPDPEIAREIDKESQNECRNCRYFSITREILTKLVEDPCETCDTSHRNWKPKEE